LLFTVAVPIENVVVLPVVGTLSRLAGLLLVVSAVPTFLTRGSFKVRRQSFAVLLLGVYVIWSFAGLLWTIEPSSTITYVTTFAQLFVFLVVLWQVCVNESGRKAIQQAYVIGCTLAALDGVKNFVLGITAVYLRFAVTNTDPNDFALVLALGIPIAWDLFATGRAWKRVLNLLYIPSALGVIVLSGSRGGTLAALVALLVLPFGFRTLDRFGRRAVVALMVAGTATVFAFSTEITTAVGSNLERISGIGADISSGSLNEREEIWAAGIEAFSERPIFGAGGGAFPAAIEKLSGLNFVAHNTFISVAVETGVVGFMLFIAILVVTLLPHLRAFDARSMPSLILFATLIVGIVPLSWEFRKPLWLVIAMLLLMRGIQVGSPSPAEPPPKVAVLPAQKPQ